MLNTINNTITTNTITNTAAGAAAESRAKAAAIANEDLRVIISEVHMFNLGLFIADDVMHFNEYCALLVDTVEAQADNNADNGIGISTGNKLVDLLASFITPRAKNDNARRAFKELLADMSLDEYLNMLADLALKEDGSVDEEAAERYKNLKDRISRRYGFSRTLVGGLKKIFDCYAEYWREYDHIRHVLQCKEQLDRAATFNYDLIEKELQEDGITLYHTPAPEKKPLSLEEEAYPLDDEAYETDEETDEADDEADEADTEAAEADYEYDEYDKDDYYDYDAYLRDTYSPEEYERLCTYDPYDNERFHEYDVIGDECCDDYILPSKPCAYFYIEALEYDGAIPFYSENSIYRMMLGDYDFSPEKIKKEAESCYSSALGELIEQCASESEVTRIKSGLEEIYRDIYELIVRPYADIK